jgi:hypothetical protein
MGFTGSFRGLLNPNMVPLRDSSVVPIVLISNLLFLLVFMGTTYGTTKK